MKNKETNKTLDKDKEKINRIKEEVALAPLESVKTELDMYIDTIVRYRFLDACTSGAFFHKLYHQELNDWMELNRKAKDKKSFNEVMFGKKLTPEEEREHLIAYYKRLVGWAKNHLTMCVSDEEKRKIIMDCIKQQELWSDMFTKTLNLRKEIESKKMKNTDDKKNQLRRKKNEVKNKYTNKNENN